VLFLVLFRLPQCAFALEWLHGMIPFVVNCVLEAGEQGEADQAGPDELSGQSRDELKRMKQGQEE
jgi:hypothetical protein